MWARLFGTIVLLAIICIHSPLAFAIVGAVDQNNQFPFVVQIEGSFAGKHAYRCSGVVHGHILSTAAHCLYDAKHGGSADPVVVTYIDAAERKQTARAVKIYVPDAYKKADALGLYDMTVAVHDIGYAVLDRDALTKGYLHWGIDIGIPTGKASCAEPECADWSLDDEQRRTIFLRSVSKIIGDLAKAKLLVVGFGNFQCADYDNREQDCKSDGQRRFVELPLVPNAQSTPAPWLWCSGKDVEHHTNPIQHGDSGGPVFVKALDGRWLYVGYTSGGNSNFGCASSMFNDLNLWVRAIASYEFGDVTTPSKEVDDAVLFAWEVSAARQYFKEWLAVENMASEEWTSETMIRLYTGMLSSRDELGDERSINYYGRNVPFKEVVSDKIRYVGKWSRRAMAVDSTLTTCDEHPADAAGTCTISSLVEWSASNTEKTLSGRSAIMLTVRVPQTFSKALILDTSAPKVVGEISVLLARGSRDTKAASLRRTKKLPTGGFINLRTGPGQNFEILQQIRGGESITIAGWACVLPRDNISTYPFCPAAWNGLEGFVSASGFE